MEVGAGHGLNFAYYPAEVTHVVAVEPDPYRPALARASAAHAPVSVEGKTDIADALPAVDGGFAAAVTSAVQCSVGDPSAALRGIARALRPGRELRVYEHVVSHHPMARVQRALHATIHPPLAGGCHCARDTRAAILDTGFQIDHDERIVFKPSPFSPPTPHILGTAGAARGRPCREKQL